MKLAFEKLIEKYDLEVSELPKITQVEIREINALKGLIESKQTIGQKVTPETMEKLKTKDSSIVDDILEFIEDQDSEEEQEQEEFEEEQEQEEETDDSDDDDDSDDEDGVSIDSELNDLFKSGRTTLNFSQIRNFAPTTYECLFETYGQDEENGIITSNYSIIETSPNSEKFNISKI
jgi:hypothetical protein